MKTTPFKQELKGPVDFHLLNPIAAPTPLLGQCNHHDDRKLSLQHRDSADSRI